MIYIIRCKLGHFVERHQVFIYKLPVNLTEHLNLSFRRLPATLPLSALSHPQGKRTNSKHRDILFYYCSSSCI